MLFTSIEFLLFFFPIVLTIYFIIPSKVKNFWLLVSSLFFYAWGEPDFVLIMVFSICFNYIMALAIDKLFSGKNFRKGVLFLSIFVNLGILMIFKYLNFITASLHSWIPITKELFCVTTINLPIGISFFTFQALSYIIDVYRGIPAQKNLINLGLYISLFPQLIAGPIVRYTTVMNQITSRKASIDLFSKGVIRFLEGFNKKVLLANTFALVADAAFGAEMNSVGMAWLGALCYTLQIFFDFSGYSDMAIGLGYMFGFRFLENFDYPYISKTVTEFWRRWHISLGTWFRDYVYFPLGGSKIDSKKRMTLNLFTVWTLTGIWHGANWTFILWGMLYGVIITVEKLASIPQRTTNRNILTQFLYGLFTFVVVMSGWVLFRSETLAKAGLYLRTMFGAGSGVLIDGVFIFHIREYCLFLIVGIISSVPVFKLGKAKLRSLNNRLGDVADNVYVFAQLGLFIISFSFLVMKAHNPFIYFNF